MPMYPPPTMATLFGRLPISRASVLPMTCGESAPGTGRTAGAEPEARRMRSAPERAAVDLDRARPREARRAR